KGSFRTPPSPLRGQQRLSPPAGAGRSGVLRVLPGWQAGGVHRAAPGGAPVLRRNTGAPGVAVPPDQGSPDVRRPDLRCLAVPEVLSRHGRVGHTPEPERRTDVPSDPTGPGPEARGVRTDLGHPPLVARGTLRAALPQSCCRDAYRLGEDARCRGPGHGRGRP